MIMRLLLHLLTSVIHVMMMMVLRIVLVHLVIASAPSCDPAILLMMGRHCGCLHLLIIAATIVGHLRRHNVKAILKVAIVPNELQIGQNIADAIVATSLRWRRSSRGRTIIAALRTLPHIRILRIKEVRIWDIHQLLAIRSGGSFAAATRAATIHVHLHVVAVTVRHLPMLWGHYGRRRHSSRMRLLPLVIHGTVIRVVEVAPIVRHRLLLHRRIILMMVMVLVVAVVGCRLLRSRLVPTRVHHLRLHWLLLLLLHWIYATIVVVHVIAVTVLGLHLVAERWLARIVRLQATLHHFLFGFFLLCRARTLAWLCCGRRHWIQLSCGCPTAIFAGHFAVLVVRKVNVSLEVRTTLVRLQKLENDSHFR